MKEFLDSVRAFVDRMIRHEAKYKTARRVLQSQDFTSVDLRSISIITAALDVKIEQAKDATCMLVIETEDSRDSKENVSFEGKIDGKTLIVRSSERYLHGAELVVWLPSDWVSTDVRTKDGDVFITNCSVKRVAVSTESADISINGVVCDDMELSSRNGDVSALNIESKNKIRATSINGDVVR